MTYLPQEINHGDHIRPPPNNNLCIFCYKSLPAVADASGWAANQSCGAGEASHWYTTNNTENTSVKVNMTTFFKSVEQFVGTQVKSTRTAFSNEKDLSGFLINSIGDSEMRFSCCEDCTVIVHSFCDVYRQLKSLELQLEWKLESLVSIMNLANKVPSRVQTLHNLFEGKEKEEDVAENDGINAYQDDSQTRSENISKLESFKIMRDIVAKSCAVKRSKCEPLPPVEPMKDLEFKDIATSDTSDIEDIGALSSPKDAAIEDSIFTDSHNHDLCEKDDVTTADSFDANGSVAVFGKKASLEREHTRTSIPGSVGTSQLTDQRDVIKCQKNQSQNQIFSFDFSKQDIKRQCSSRLTTFTRNQIAQKEKPFYCVICNISYKSYSSLQQHKKNEFHQLLLNKQLKNNLNFLDYVYMNVVTKDENKIEKETTSKSLSQVQLYNLGCRRKRSYEIMMKGLPDPEQ